MDTATRVQILDETDCIPHSTNPLGLSYLPNPSALTGYDTRSILKRSLTGLNSEFSFSLTTCLTNAEEPSLPYYLPIAGGRIIGFIPFPRVLVLCEMQSVSSRIWTRVAVSISYDDNHYTKGTSLVLQSGHSLGVGSYSSAEVQLVYSTAPANWAIRISVYIYIYIYIYITCKLADHRWGWSEGSVLLRCRGGCYSLP